MDREAKKLANRLAKYADAITAFAFVQSVAFGFSLAQHEVRESILNIPGKVLIITGVAYFIYGFLVYSCNCGEEALLVDPTKLDEWTNRLRKGRFIVVILAAAISLFAVGLTIHGNRPTHSSQPFTDPLH